MKKSAWFFFFLLLMLSCLDEPDCYQLNANVIGIRFRVIGSESLDTLSLTGIQVAGIFDGADRTTTFVQLPLDYANSESDVLISLADGSTRSIKLGYNAQTQYVSEDCGVRYILSSLQSKSSDFDSVRIVNGTPSKSGGDNIEVLRCPQTNIMTVSFRDFYQNTQGDSAARAGSMYVRSIQDDLGNTLYTDTSRTNYKLYVDLAKDASTFTFNLQDGTSKKLSVGYKRRSVENYFMCGPKTFVDTLSVTESEFAASAIVVDSDGEERTSLTDPSLPNIYLYNCPRTNLVRIDFRERTSPTSTNTRAKEMPLLGIVPDYNPDTTFYAADTLSSVVLPVNETTLTTTFTIRFNTTPVRTETVTLTYTAEEDVLVAPCGSQRIYSDLTLDGDATNASINVIEDATTLTFPPTSNLEIIIQ